MKKRMKKVATLCLAGVTAMSTVGVTGSAVFAKGDTNYDVESIRNSLQALATGASAQEVGDDIVDKMSAYE